MVVSPEFVHHRRGSVERAEDQVQDGHVRRVHLAKRWGGFGMAGRQPALGGHDSGLDVERGAHQVAVQVELQGDAGAAAGAGGGYMESRPGMVENWRSVEWRPKRPWSRGWRPEGWRPL